MEPLIQQIRKEEFEEHFSMLFNRIFSGDSVAGASPFSNKAWEVVLFPYGLNMEDVTYQALARSADVVGDKELIITDIGALPPHQSALILPWSRSTLDKVRYTHGLIAAVDSALFGRSGAWGAIVYYDDFGCFGASQEVMDVFSSEMGGRAAVKERFLNYEKSEWHIDSLAKNKIIKTVGWS